jgi:hypothetical protein
VYVHDEQNAHKDRNLECELVSVWSCICMYACVYVCMYVCMYVCVCVSVCMRECVYVCMHARVYIYVCLCAHLYHQYASKPKVAVINHAKDV